MIPVGSERRDSCGRGFETALAPSLTLRRRFCQLLRQRRTDDEASFPTTAAECSSQVPFWMERGEQLALWVKAHRCCLQAAHCEDVQTERCAGQ